MNLRAYNDDYDSGERQKCGGHRPPLQSHRASGSVLIIVMWIAFGVVGLALYFAHSMELNMIAADNQMGQYQADQAIESAGLYYSNVLATRSVPTMLPQTNNYRTSNVKVGDGTFWCIGRDTNDNDISHRSPDPIFCLVDEASKANLNNTKLYNSPTNLLQYLPQMTQPILAAMYDWSSTNTTASTDGAKASTYQGLNPPYLCKNTNYDTVGELRMVYGMSLDLEYGEDINLNGALDPNENDGMTLPPTDNQNGLLDSGFLEYLTVYTHEPTNYGTTNRQSVTDLTALTAFIQTNFPTVYTAISQKLRTMTAPTSVLDFAIKSGVSESDMITMEPYLYGSNTVGLININTASATALACIPGIGYTYASSVLSYRQSNPSRLNSVFWLKDAMSSAGTNAMLQAGPWITSLSFQYMADVAAVGHNGRGYRRVRFVYDCSSGVPLIIYRQDLTYLGWALGKKIHDQLLSGKI